MNEFDEKGWAPIHHAVYRGFVKSVERFVKAGPEQLELPTRDELRCTPFLVATIAGNLETVTQMMSLNCNINATDTQSHGAIEIAALRQHINVLEHFLSLNNSALPVLQNLLKMIRSSEDEMLASARCLKVLTQEARSNSKQITESLLDTNYRLVSTIFSVLSDLTSGSAEKGDPILFEVCELLFNLFTYSGAVLEECERGNFLPLLLRLFKAELIRTRIVQAHAVRLLRYFVRTHEHADTVLRQGVIGSLLKMLKRSDGVVSTVDQLLLDALQLITVLASFGTDMQAEICRDTDLLRFLVDVYRTSRQKETILALTASVCALISSNKANQTLLLQLGIADAVLECLRLKSLEVQTAAVDALQLLCAENEEVQRLFKAKHVYVPLLALLKRSRQPSVQKKILDSLWMLAAGDLNEQQLVAKLVGVLQLYSNLSSPDEQLRFVSMQMITALALAPICTRHEVANLTGVQTLVGLLDTDNRELLLQVMRTVRQLALGIAYVANRAVQEAVDRVRGTWQLVAIMQRAVVALDDRLYLEAAFTLSALCLNNKPIMLKVRSVADFSFSRILQTLATVSTNNTQGAVQNETQTNGVSAAELRFLAGSALAAFLYGSLREQAIASVEASLASAPVRFRYFVDSLKHSDTHRRIEAAFQIVVLCKVVTDELFTITSATGIKILSDTLEASLRNSDEAIVFHALETIARLLRLRSAGITEAFLAVGVVDILAKLLLPDLVVTSGRHDECSADLPHIFGHGKQHYSENVRGAAAIALTFLSYFAEGRNRIMTYCRRFPQLVALVMHYVRPVLTFSKVFLETWSIFESQMLPELKKETRVNLVTINPVDVALEKVKELSYLSLSKDDGTLLDDTYSSLPAANLQRRGTTAAPRSLLTQSAREVSGRISEEPVAPVAPATPTETTIAPIATAEVSSG